MRIYPHRDAPATGRDSEEVIVPHHWRRFVDSRVVAHGNAELSHPGTWARFRLPSPTTPSIPKGVCDGVAMDRPTMGHLDLRPLPPLRDSRVDHAPVRHQG